MRDFIDNIDWGKNLIFLIVYAGIVSLCIFIYLVPIMDNYKSAIMEYRKTNILDNQINTTLERLKQSEANLVRENSAVFTRLGREVDLKELQTFARTHIKGAKVADMGIAEAENGIAIHSFKITGQTRSLASVKNLIASVSGLESSVRIAFPITIHKRQGRNTLEFEMTIMVFNAKRDISVESGVESSESSVESIESNAVESVKSSADLVESVEVRTKSNAKSVKLSADSNDSTDSKRDSKDSNASKISSDSTPHTKDSKRDSTISTAPKPNATQ